MLAVREKELILEAGKEMKLSMEVGRDLSDKCGRQGKMIAGGGGRRGGRG